MLFDFTSQLSGISTVVNITSSSRKFTGYIDALDLYDLYQFAFSSSSSFHMSFSGMSANADLRLLSSGAQVLHSSTNGGTSNENVDAILDSGTYYIQIYPHDIASTAYNANVSAIASSYAPEDISKIRSKGDILTNFDWQKSNSKPERDRYTDDIFVANTVDEKKERRHQDERQDNKKNWDVTSLVNSIKQALAVDAVSLVTTTDQNSSTAQTETGNTASSVTTTDQNSSEPKSLANETGLTKDEIGSVPILNANSPASVNPEPIFTSFSVIDASGDNTFDTVLEGGAIKVSYDLANGEPVSKVKLEVVQFDSIVGNLGTWNQTKISNNQINLANFTSITAGDYLVRAIASTTNGQEIFSSFQSLRILPWNQTLGSFTANTLNYSNLVPGEAAVFLGRGGTDTLNLAGIARADVTSINGINLSAFNPLSNSTANQAIFQGTAFDYLTLADGSEIYFQGIENLKFADGNIELQVRPNDPSFGYQWNFHVSDVDSAWRFTQGTNNILLASLDTGILTAPGGSGSIFDISLGRLITDPTDDDNFDGTNSYGHGHSSISIMSSTPNNNSGIAGINWNSQVYANDVYRGVSLLQAISDTIDYARANNMRVVFQAGIQGDYWLNYSGGTQEQLEQLIQNNSDIALFAVGAGNGGPGGNDPDPNYLTSVNGLARLETTHSNVMSVGALETKADVNGLTQWQYEWVNNLLNAKVANIAPYSNRGSNLTLMVATDSPAVDKYGNVNYFGGTSASNPNLAGIASLVWSINPNLNAGQVRQILIDTAMDLGVTGRDNTFGYGLVNADAAVRRAWALQNNSELANLYGGSSLLV